MRTGALIVAALATCALVGCKSLPMGSFALMNSPAMEVAKLTPQIAVADEDRRIFLSDRQLVGMSISGGGMRASAFALGIFAGLEEIKNSAGNQSALDMVDFASSNSGGSWALAAHLTDLRTIRGFTASGDYQKYAKAFAQLNESRTREWANAMRDMLGYDMKLSDLPVRPRAYFNAAILPSQDGFVFSQKFVDAYRIEKFYARGSDQPFGTSDIQALPLGYVAATSGSVPGFTHSYAETALCRAGGPRPSFCGPDESDFHGWIRLVDGGLYDNLAYKTAWEVAKTASEAAVTDRRIVYLVDSKNGWPIPTVGRKDARSHDGILEAGRKLLFQGSFPLQEATFRRLAPSMFNAIGFRTVLLDFDAASNFAPDNGIKVDDLDQLLAMASDEIDCVEDSGTVLKAKARKRPAGTSALKWLKDRGGDCLSNNFARVGYHHQTSYYFDPHYFAATYQLGMLVARMREAEIRKELGCTSA